MVWQCSVCCKGEVTVDDEGFSGREKAISQLKNLNSILENCTLSKVLSYSTDVMLTSVTNHYQVFHRLAIVHSLLSG